MKKILFSLVLIILFFFPLNVFSAEILQINTTQNIIIGDQNRKLTVSLPCIKVKITQEKIALEMLKKDFPKGTKIKIKPFASDDTFLSAQIFRVDNKNEMTQILLANDLAENTCNRN